MTNSQIFIAAHKLAKTFEGNYQACFSLALKDIYTSLKSNDVTTDCQNPEQFGVASEIMGTYYLNQRFNKIQLDIDVVDFDFVSIQKRFNTIEEMKSFLTSNYNYSL